MGYELWVKNLQELCSLHEKHGTWPSQPKEIANMEKNLSGWGSMKACEVNLPSPAKAATTTRNQHSGNWEEDGYKARQGSGATPRPEVHLHRKKDWGISGSFQSIQLRQRSITQTDTSENKGPRSCSQTLRHWAFSRLELDMEPVAFLTRDFTCVVPRPRPETFGRTNKFMWAEYGECSPPPPQDSY